MHKYFKYANKCVLFSLSILYAKEGFSTTSNTITDTDFQNTYNEHFSGSVSFNDAGSGNGPYLYSYEEDVMNDTLFNISNTSNDFTFCFTGPTLNGANICKQGPGTLKLQGQGGTGTTQIDEGTLQISSASNLNSGDVIFNGGTLSITEDATDEIILSHNIQSLPDGGNVNIADEKTLTIANISGEGAFTINGDGSLTSQDEVTVDTGKTLTLVNNLSTANVTGDLVKSGEGTLIVQGTSGSGNNVEVLAGKIETTPAVISSSVCIILKPNTTIKFTQSGTLSVPIQLGNPT